MNEFAVQLTLILIAAIATGLHYATGKNAWISGAFTGGATVGLFAGMLLL